MRIGLFLNHAILIMFGLWKYPQTNSYDHSRQVNDDVNIRFELGNRVKNDTLLVKLYENYVDPYFPTTTTVLVKDSKGKYIFQVGKASRPFYISLESISDKKINGLINLYLVEPGDNIDVFIYNKKKYDGEATNSYNDKYTVKFSGKGSPKFLCRYEIDNALVDIPGYKIVDAEGKFIKENRFDLCQIVADKIFLKYRNRMKSSTYSLLRCDFFSFNELERLYWMYHIQSPFKDSSLTQRVIKWYEGKIEGRLAEFSNGTKLMSSRYAQFISERALMGQLSGYYKLKRHNDIQKVFLELVSKYKGELRDKVITFLSIRLATLIFGQNMSILKQAIDIVKTEYCVPVLNSIYDANEVGKLAYNFSLQDTTGKFVKLEDFRGKIVLIDFWFTGCSSCIQYYKNVISIAEEKFKNNPDVVFVAISTDQRKEQWLESIRRGIYTASESINLYTEGEGTSHEIIKHYRVYGYPRPLLIGWDGKVFSNQYNELKGQGAKGLLEVIDRALKEKNLAIKTSGK